jgi:DNA-directed RNA polymerase subunit L
MANAPERFLTWRWAEDPPEDENIGTEDPNIPKRLTYTKDSKKPNAGTFILSKQDHTLGNLLRVKLLRDPGVRFAGYRVPHPLIFDCHVRVETMDAKLTPTQVNSMKCLGWKIYADSQFYI